MRPLASLQRVQGVSFKVGYGSKRHSEMTSHDEGQIDHFDRWYLDQESILTWIVSLERMVAPELMVMAGAVVESTDLIGVFDLYSGSRCSFGQKCERPLVV
jgi:hypothetical protein